MEGYILLHRRVQEHWLIMEEEAPFSRFEAWIHLLFMANYRDKKILVDGVLYKCKRGQLFTSVKSLSIKFRWSEKKVRGLLKLLKQDDMIEYEGLRKGTRITICNYDSYQVLGRAEGEQRANRSQTEGEQREGRGQTEGDTRIKGIKEKKVNKGNERNAIGAANFKKPTIEEIQVLMQVYEIKNFESQAAKFLAYQESRGWMSGQTPIINWRAACKQWIENIKPEKNEQSDRKAKEWEQFNELTS